MNKFIYTTILCFLSLSVVITLSCNPATLPSEEPVDNFRLSMKYEAQIDSMIKAMTLEEKVGLLHGNGKFTTAGVEKFGIPEIQYTDGPLGIREEIERDSWNPVGLTTDSATFFPAGGGLSATWNLDLAAKYGEAMGKEARARDKHILLAPAVNIIRTPLCGRNYEYFSEDPFLNKKIAVPMIIGIQNQDVAACVKHYAVNNQETNRDSVSAEVNERALREIYLPVYKAAVQEAEAYSFMGAYNRFRGEYLCENDYMLNKILKDEWGFKGFVVSDWAAVHSTVKSAKSGLDVEMGSNKPFDEFYFAQPLIDAVNAGEVSEEDVNEKVRRVLRVLLNIKISGEGRVEGAINTQEIRRTVYKTATESVVLLKNADRLLPLNISSVSSLAVIGDNAVRKHASGGFGAGVKAQKEVSPLEGLQHKLGDRVKITFAQGYQEQYMPGEENKRVYLREKNNTPDPALIEEAVNAAKNADFAIVFAGSNRDVESESADRLNMELPFGQVELIKEVVKANPNTIVVMVVGAPFEMEEIHKNTPALLWSWFNGSEAGTALADILFGDVNPSGKLPFTIPAKLNDSPAHALNAFPGTPNEVVYKEGIFVGYRWFDSRQIKPMYSFGYGLSYTQFSYSDAATDRESYKENDKIKATVTVKNIGDRSGKEIVQLYVRHENSSVERAEKELKGFTKVHVEAGEAVTVNIDLDVKELAYFDEQQMSWVVEPGTYRLLFGTSSDNILGSTTVTISGIVE